MKPLVLAGVDGREVRAEPERDGLHGGLGHDLSLRSDGEFPVLVIRVGRGALRHVVVVLGSVLLAVHQRIYAELGLSSDDVVSSLWRRAVVTPISRDVVVATCPNGAHRRESLVWHGGCQI